MNIIEKATQHYAAQERLVINVPEWDEEIHVLPMNMAEVNMMQKIGGRKASSVEQAVNLIIVKARDKDGKRLFSVHDREKLMEQADYAVISRIAEQIEQRFFGDIEVEKGNSDATPPAIAS